MVFALDRRVFFADIVAHRNAIFASLLEFRKADIDSLAAVVSNDCVRRIAEQIYAVGLFDIALIVKFGDNHTAHLCRSHCDCMNF